MERGTGVVVYSDYVCPYCYLFEPALRRLRDHQDVALEYRALELRPAPRPLPAPDDHGLSRSWRETVEPLGRRLGVEMHRPPCQPRTGKAHELAAFAREQGRFDDVHDALFRAFFVDGVDIGRIDVLVAVADAVGLDADAAHRALGLDIYTERVAEDARAAEAHGVDRVPTLVHGSTLLIGLQPYERLESWIEGADATDIGSTTERS